MSGGKNAAYLLPRLLTEHEIFFGWLPSAALMEAVRGAIANGIEEKEVWNVFYGVGNAWKLGEVRGAADEEMIRRLRDVWRDRRK